MTSASGRFVIVFNGEIYNFRELSRELAALGQRFRGRSDTEVILGAVEAWGLTAAVRRFAGIFAFALWDRDEQALHLVRDHLGVKPLYYARVGRALLFGSELRALSSHPEFDRTLDRRAIALLLRSSCVPAPYTIYAGAAKLAPGTVLTVRPGEDARAVAAVPYWSAEAAASAGLTTERGFTDQDALDALDTLLRDVVRSQMVADVPLGAFLSGGIDSSTVVALMQAQSAAPIRTFSIGFGRSDFDESAHAAEVAAHLGTSHTSLRVTDEDARAVVPLLPRLWDEPFADASQIPTYLVSRLARRSVTVALSGDGGGRTVRGVQPHVWAERLWRRLRRVPRPVRAAAGVALASIAPETWDRGARATGLLRGTAIGEAQFGRKLHKLAGVLGAAGADELYADLASHWTHPHEVVMGVGARESAARQTGTALAGASFTERMMLRDLVTYLPDDILVKVDRASMCGRAGARVPLLDHRVVELPGRCRCGSSCATASGSGSCVASSTGTSRVRLSIDRRPGFAVPLAAWLRGPLRSWADDLLAPNVSRPTHTSRPLRYARVAGAQAGGRDWSPHLWNVLMFQAWLHDGPG
jgi:asparagine synthase (glutamine-hydrolysing)